MKAFLCYPNYQLLRPRKSNVHVKSKTSVPQITSLFKHVNVKVIYILQFSLAFGIPLVNLKLISRPFVSKI